MNDREFAKFMMMFKQMNRANTTDSFRKNLNSSQWFVIATIFFVLFLGSFLFPIFRAHFLVSIFGLNFCAHFFGSHFL